MPTEPKEEGSAFCGTAETHKNLRKKDNFMKGRKLLAGFLSAAMVLATMSFPVFAENTDNSLIEVSDSDTLKEAVNNIAENGTIKFTNEITVTRDGGNDPGVITFTKNCTVDLNGQTLNTGELLWFAGSETVTFTSSAENGTIKFGDVSDSLFRPNENGSFSIENITFTQTENTSVCYLFNMDGENSSINLKNCVLDNINTKSYGGVICGNNSENTKASIENCQITDITGVAVFGGQVTVKDSTISATTPFKIASANHYAVLSGETTITGGNYYNNGNKIYTIGEDVTVDNRITTTVPAATIGTTPYATLADAVAAAQNGDVIDLLGGTIALKDTGVTTVPINKNITITNGTFDITGFVAARSNSIFDIYGGAEVKFEDVDFTGSNYSSSYGVIYAHETSEVTLNNCDFELDTEKDTANGGVLKGNDYTNDKFVVNNCNFTLKNTSRVFALMTIDMNGGSINATHEPISEEHAFRNVYGTIDGATISFDNFQNGIKNTANAALTFTDSNVTSTNMNEYDLQLAGGATVSGVAFENTNCEATVSPAVTTFANTAAIGTTYYATLEDAFAAAQEGEVITLLDDVTPTLPRQRLLTNAQAINLNNNTLTLNGYDYYWGPMTFTNGTINVTTESFPGTAVFWQFTDEDLTFDGVEVNAPNLTGCYLITTDHGGSDINIVNGSVINVANPLAAVIASNGANCNITIEESTVNADSTGGHAILANNATVNLENGAELNADGVACGIYFGANGALNIADDAVVNITNVTGDPDWNANKGGIMLGSNTTYTEGTEATVNASIHRSESAETVAAEVEVSFRETAEKGKYDIVLKGVDRMNIYEFVSAELQFVNESKTLANTDMSYEITGTDDINVIANTDKPNRYGFYLKDGEVDNRITATEIVIGQVTFPAQGTIKFKVDADNSKVVATEYNTHDEKYYTAADQNAKLTADANGINSTIAAKTRDVAINVDFAHTLDNTGWNGNHQITVTLKDAFGNIVGDKAYPLAIANNAGTYTFPNVPIGRITVTLKAPGFRTFTYTTTVEEGANEDDALVLNFWNDTKRDTERAVEIGGRTMPNNFVVGDIVMDYTVDKYDLAAVTSYYGTYRLDDTSKIKYDLNRDGNIDITDVAYVLHNFGF